MSLKREEIYALTISALELSPRTTADLVERVHQIPDYRLRLDLSRSTTVEEVIKTFGTYQFGHKPGKSTRDFMRKLEEMGLTRLDWPPMPARTITIAALKELPSHELLSRHVSVLGTVSNELQQELVYWLDGRETMTVQKLLRFEFDSVNPESRVRMLRRRFRASVENTRQLLKQLLPADYLRCQPFMTFGTQGALVDQLMEKYTHLSGSEAQEIARIAGLEGWVPAFLPN